MVIFFNIKNIYFSIENLDDIIIKLNEKAMEFTKSTKF